MSQILEAIHLADGVLNTEGYSIDLDTLRPENYYDNILKKYGVSRALFDSALYQYSKDELLLEEMYAEIIERLSTKELFVKEKIKEQALKIEQKKRKKDFFKFTYLEDFENSKDNNVSIEESLLSTKQPHGGKQAYISGSKKDNLPVKSIVKQALKSCNFQLKAFVKFEHLPKEYPFVVFEIQKNGEVLNQFQYDLKRLKAQAKSWTFLDLKTSLNITEYTEGAQVYCCIVNPSQQSFLLDDYQLNIRQEE